MSIPKLYVTSADPAAVKQVAGLLGGLDGLYVTVSDIMHHITTTAAEKPQSIDALRAYTKHLVEASEPFLPGGHILLEDFYDEASSAEVLTESVRRAVLWGRHTGLVLPVTLSSIEAANMLSRMGNALAFGPVCTIDQVAAILAATEEATLKQVTVIVPVGQLVLHSINVTSFVESLQSLFDHVGCEVQLILQVEAVGDLAWACGTGVAAIAVTPAVMTAWVAAGKPTGADSSTIARLASGVVLSPTGIDFTKEKNSFAVSNPMTDELLAANVAAVAQILK